ncbi:glutathione S-transferase family protein [Bradyrhizobium prioriisuperbiae]|uniref:glutathione S-transferase family protein n=1 Tax=Bradyrhizobium prioriisuperbiae TaxID=2854389 RepID=UPI0028E6B5DC|nr:glutathione S-transferase family protein [Bradyrhizobium prioritasuperba]
MTPVLLTGFPLGSSLGLVAAFEWLGQPYQLSRVQMPDDMTTDIYGRINGRRETPVLITGDGSPLTETMAIALWLETRDHDRRISFAPGSGEADRLHQVMAFLNTGFTGAFSPLWVAFEMQTADAAFRDALRTFGRSSVARRHEQLEAMIGDGPYLLGDRPTLADAIFVGVARWADFHQAIDPGVYPKIRALKSRLERDPAVRLALAIEDGEAVPESSAMTGLVPLKQVLQGAAV